MDISTPAIFSKKWLLAYMLTAAGMTIGSKVKMLLDVTPGPFIIYAYAIILFYAIFLRALEDNVRATCGDLIQECIVVGYGRPSPTLVVEALSNMDEEKLKKDIIQATRPFNSRRYMHERIVSEKMIIVVPPNSLPRTASKGNIRRRAVEEAYKTKLDEIYAKA